MLNILNSNSGIESVLNQILLKIYYALLKTNYCFPLVYFFFSIIGRKFIKLKWFIGRDSCDHPAFLLINSDTTTTKKNNPDGFFPNPDVISR